MTRAVIFDLDDTLISERKYVESGYLHIAKIIKKSYGKDEEELYNLLIDLYKDSPKKVFNRLFDKLGVAYSQSDIMELVKDYRNHLPNIDFFDDVLPCLGLLKEKNIKIGIITDGYASAQRQKLKAVKAVNYFNEIIVTDELGKEYWKPHPKSFEVMKEKLNVKFNDMIYIGDNPEKDFYIGSMYPIKTIRIYRDGVYKDKNYLSNIKEDYSIHTLNELNSIIT
ncbi:HAD family hydrolase [Lentibacillus cibarius]|uniref:HAD family hydrolase n=1 Tax=Lentibacillus cibarius TaxID=2583219 RepID=A0A5S3QJM8_9BACI|nr:HAD-IA family hydrolase [Lentibacillus cibarius]TMN21937.1 HAD family hydrolase [Lentibacillus cibarius]